MPFKQPTEAERLAVALHVCKLIVWKAKNQTPNPVKERELNDHALDAWAKGALASPVKQRQWDDDLEVWAKGALTIEQRNALIGSEWPNDLPGAVKEAIAKEMSVSKAFACARTLEEAYVKGGPDGSVDWADVQMARGLAQEALGSDGCAKIARNLGANAEELRTVSLSGKTPEPVQFEDGQSRKVCDDLVRAFIAGEGSKGVDFETIAATFEEAKRVIGRDRILELYREVRPDQLESYLDDEAHGFALIR